MESGALGSGGLESRSLGWNRRLGVGGGVRVGVEVEGVGVGGVESEGLGSGRLGSEGWGRGFVVGLKLP